MITLVFSANIVLAVLTAFAELVILPSARWMSDRIEGKQLHSELMQGYAIKVKRRELGPLRLSLGRQTPIKVFTALMLSGGVIVVTVLAEYGFEPSEYEQDVTRRIDAKFVPTRDGNYKNDFVKLDSPSYMSEISRCVDVGKMTCKHRELYGDRTCIRSVYNEAVIQDGKLICADRDTGNLRNASDVDVILYDEVIAKVENVGKRMRYEPEALLMEANHVNMSLEGVIMPGIQMRILSLTGVNIFWNDSTVFLTLYGRWLSADDWYPAELGFFPNSRHSIRDYVDSALTLAALSLNRFRMDAIATVLIQMHFAATERVNGTFHHVDSEIVQSTNVTLLSIVMLSIIVVGMVIGWFGGLGQRSSFGAYNGLSRLYDDDIEKRESSEAPNQFVDIGLMTENDGCQQRIGCLQGRDAAVRDETLPMDVRWMDVTSIEPASTTEC